MKQKDDEPKELNQRERAQFEELLSYLKRNRGFDFAGYKQPSLVRRVSKRMEIAGITGFDRYMDYLEVHPEEFALLFNHLLINVTTFFRDPAAWDFLDTQLLPKLIEEKRPDEPIRVWSAGCSTGQEPYCLAMLLCEHLGMKAFQQRVKIYASDVDENALSEARMAVYAPKEIQSVPKKLFEKYFEPVGNRFMIKPDLRRLVIFGRHDLLTDAPISRLDLLVCRNTLMYFNAETQNHILARFHFALNDLGSLFLGKAEMLLTHTNLFNPIDQRYRAFMKVVKMSLRDRLLVLNQMGDEEGGQRLARQVRVREAAFDVSPYAQIVVDVEGNLALANDHARAIFSVMPRDLGRAFRDLEISYRPVELRSPIEQVYAERKPLRLTDVERHLAGDTTQKFEVDIVPLLENGGAPIGAVVTFHDVTRIVQLQGELQRSKQELETAYEELQSTNEELETTNEELQSTVEELETTNEELQSTNEELETMNEELQSTNEELQTVNIELRDRTDELLKSNEFQKAILASLRSGVAVLDQRLNVLIWNQEAENVWGLRADEVKGRSFVGLDIGLPVDRLAAPLRRVVSSVQDGYETLEIQAVNRRGKAITAHVTCSPLRLQGGPTTGVIVLMEERNNADPPSSDH
jgi:two-component system CheB/CheR fusion protein